MNSNSGLVTQTLDHWLIWPQPNTLSSTWIYGPEGVIWFIISCRNSPEVFEVMKTPSITLRSFLNYSIAAKHRIALWHRRNYRYGGLICQQFSHPIAVIKPAHQQVLPCRQLVNYGYSNVTSIRLTQRQPQLDRVVIASTNAWIFVATPAHNSTRLLWRM